MKNLFTLLFSSILIVAFSMNISQAQKINDQGIYEGIIKIKFNENQTNKLDALHQQKNNTFNILQASNGFVQTGITELDNKNSDFGATTYKRVFRYGGKFEAKHRKSGLHLWYEITFSTKASVDQLLEAYSRLGEIQYVEAKREAKLLGGSGKTISGTNDPRFSDQWHYENTGQNNGTPGADISLLQAWEVETGNSQVIVAIEDGGIDYNHEDLAGNMWNNPGEIAGNGVDDDNNGYVDDYYGYNFAENTGTIGIEDHGTHVAGTVAAETNNDKGVSGIAGGSGSDDGVRLMSCNVFSGNKSGGFDEAYVYAADNGAVISQNSWGYTSVNVYEQTVLDAIDYFVANASGTMDGGLVIYAAGNSDADGLWWPGCYEPVLSVAATNKNDEKSYYSNFDTWVDIAAPGGELETSNTDPTAIHSTLPNNSYGVMQGTSMACPHVSGVAALIVSNNVGNITAGEVWSMLVSNTDNIDGINPSYAGKLGSGRLNAYAALTGEAPPPPPPPPPAYCSSAGSNFTYEWIAGVTIGSFNNTSGQAGYTDYTNLTIEMDAGSAYNISLVPGFRSTLYNEYWKIWIDYNNDLDFDDAGELAFDAGSMSQTTVTGVINVPSDASGITRMRVSMKYNGEQTACETFSYGEVEDYTVNISSGAPADTEAPTAPSSLTSSNVTDSSLDLNWNASTDNVGVTGYDVYQNGSLLGSVTGTSASITGLSPETTYSYFVKAKDDAGNISTASNTINVTTDIFVDVEAPSAPSNLSSSNITETTIDLSWNASSDNVGVTGYDVYMNASYYTTVSGTSANITGLSASTSYSFYVNAKDAAGNISASSSALNVTTNDPPDTQAPTAPANLASSNVTESSVGLSWDASTDNVGVTGYDVYKNGSFYGSVSGTSTTVSGLAPLTSYTFYVNAKDEVGNISGASNTINVTTLEDVVVVEYCSLTSTSTTFEWIDYVELEQIANSSYKDFYGDYTHLVATIGQGVSHTIYISAAFKRRLYTEYWSIWIDFNNDGDFDDADELVVSGSTTDGEIYNATINVPVTASLGETRMRVAMSDKSDYTSCGSFKYGEVEDYTVNIVSTLPSGLLLSNNSAKPLGNLQSKSFNVYPNPASSNLNIELPENKEYVTVKIYNVTGALIQQFEIEGNNTSFDISNFTPGMYTIFINDDSKIEMTKFVKY